MAALERSTQVVTLALNPNQISVVRSGGIFKEGEYSNQDILQLIEDAHTQGWDLLSTTSRMSDETGQQFVDMFFRKRDEY
jgi:hypothetical protein